MVYLTAQFFLHVMILWHILSHNILQYLHMMNGAFYTLLGSGASQVAH